MSICIAAVYDKNQNPLDCVLVRKDALSLVNLSLRYNSADIKILQEDVNKNYHSLLVKIKTQLGIGKFKGEEPTVRRFKCKYSTKPSLNRFVEWESLNQVDRQPAQF